MSLERRALRLEPRAHLPSNRYRYDCGRFETAAAGTEIDTTVTDLGSAQRTLTKRVDELSSQTTTTSTTSP